MRNSRCGSLNRCACLRHGSLNWCAGLRPGDIDRVLHWSLFGARRGPLNPATKTHIWWDRLWLISSDKPLWDSGQGYIHLRSWASKAEDWVRSILDLHRSDWGSSLAYGSISWRKRIRLRPWRDRELWKPPKVVVRRLSVPRWRQRWEHLIRGCWRLFWLRLANVLKVEELPYIFLGITCLNNAKSILVEPNCWKRSRTQDIRRSNDWRHCFGCRSHVSLHGRITCFANLLKLQGKLYSNLCQLSLLLLPLGTLFPFGAVMWLW